MSRVRLTCTALAPAMTLAACQSVPKQPPQHTIVHVVLVDVAEDLEIPAMRADSDRLLPTIPQVRHYVCGSPVDIGRANVSKDYDLGIIVEFDSVEDYKAYLAHPVHQQLVQTWRPKWKRSYIVDFAP
jgi:Stress responsive A/B Barrel Domain